MAARKKKTATRKKTAGKTRRQPVRKKAAKKKTATRKKTARKTGRELVRKKAAKKKTAGKSATSHADPLRDIARSFAARLLR